MIKKIIIIIICIMMIFAVQGCKKEEPVVSVSTPVAKEATEEPEEATPDHTENPGDVDVMGFIDELISAVIKADIEWLGNNMLDEISADAVISADAGTMSDYWAVTTISFGTEIVWQSNNAEWTGEYILELIDGEWTVVDGVLPMDDSYGEAPTVEPAQPTRKSDTPSWSWEEAIDRFYTAWMMNDYHSVMETLTGRMEELFSEFDEEYDLSRPFEYQLIDGEGGVDRAVAIGIELWLDEYGASIQPTIVWLESFDGQWYVEYTDYAYVDTENLSPDLNLKAGLLRAVTDYYNAIINNDTDMYLNAITGTLRNEYDSNMTFPVNIQFINLSIDSIDSSGLTADISMSEEWSDLYDEPIIRAVNLEFEYTNDEWKVSGTDISPFAIVSSAVNEQDAIESLTVYYQSILDGNPAVYKTVVSEKMLMGFDENVFTEAAGILKKYETMDFAVNGTTALATIKEFTIGEDESTIETMVFVHLILKLDGLWYVDSLE